MPKSCRVAQPPAKDEASINRTGAKVRMRRAPLPLIVALFLGIDAVSARDAEHGRLLIERWCADCHVSNLPKAKGRQAMPFEAVVAKPGVSRELIADFLMLPHATMPNLPFRRRDAEDIAEFIMQLKK